MSNSDLHRTNINLFSTDVAWLRSTYGHGWTEVVREAIASYVRDQKASRSPKGVARQYKDNTYMPSGLKKDAEGNVTFRGIPLKIKDKPSDV